MNYLIYLLKFEWNGKSAEFLYCTGLIHLNALSSRIGNAENGGQWAEPFIPQTTMDHSVQPHGFQPLTVPPGMPIVQPPPTTSSFGPRTVSYKMHDIKMTICKRNDRFSAWNENLDKNGLKWRRLEFIKSRFTFFLFFLLCFLFFFFDDYFRLIAKITISR